LLTDMAANAPKAGNIAQRVRAPEFCPSNYACGEKLALALDIGVEACGTVSVLLVRGARPGKTLAITAGIHGDEYEGVRAVFEVFDHLDPATLTGTLLAVPVANPPAFWNGTRHSPLDDANLARLFPGNPQGTVSQILAYWLGEAIIARADFYIDLHSAGVMLSMPTMVGYDARDERSRVAAFAFGAPVVWGHPTAGPGRTLTVAAAHAIPWLYTEAPGAGRTDPVDVAVFRRGVYNIMRHLGMLPGQVEAPAPRYFLLGDGDLDKSVSATCTGFFVPAVELLAVVSAGQGIGRTVDLMGRTMEVFVAPCAGAVAMLRAFPVVKPGDAVCLIAELGN
jgi:predicted deacylase